MYKKSYIRLTECMLNDDTELLFKNTLRCNNDMAFIKYVNDNGYTVKECCSDIGLPVSKVYRGKSHLMTFDMTQSVIFTDLPSKDFPELT